jgi:hypothetical protein
MAHRQPKHEPELWKALAKDTGVSEVPDLFRKYLIDHEYANVALDECEPGGYEDCLKTLRELIQIAKAGERGTRSRKRAPNDAGSESLSHLSNALATPQENDRCRVLASHFGRLGDRNFHVRRIRKFVTGEPSGVLSDDRAYAVLESPALARLSYEFFVERGIPIDWHHADLKSVTPSAAQSGRMQSFILEIRWPRGRHSEPWPSPTHVAATRERLRNLIVPRRDGSARGLTIQPTSFLSTMANACDQIRSEHWWSEPECLWFVLTGAVPDMRPVSIRRKVLRDEEASPIAEVLTIRTFQFVSPRTLSKAHASVRSQLPGPRAKRALKAKGLELFDFVEQERASSSEPCGWGTLMARWNRTAQEPSKYSDRRHFRRDYVRTREFVLLGEEDEL